jgi:hypothetical protein
MCMIRNQIFHGKGTFQKSKSISGMESHLTRGFLKTNKNQLTLYTYYYTTSDFSHKISQPSYSKMSIS